MKIPLKSVKFYNFSSSPLHFLTFPKTSTFLDLWLKKPFITEHFSYKNERKIINETKN